MADAGRTLVAMVDTVDDVELAGGLDAAYPRLDSAPSRVRPPPSRASALS